jgi:hypothetical protein
MAIVIRFWQRLLAQSATSTSATSTSATEYSAFGL